MDQLFKKISRRHFLNRAVISAAGMTVVGIHPRLAQAQVSSIGFWRNHRFTCAIANASSSGAISHDGVNWTSTTVLGTAQNWNKVCWNGNVFCAIANGPSNVAAYSTDGISWTQTTLPSSNNWNDVKWNGSQFCAISGGANKAATSPDGITWTTQTLPSIQTWYCLEWNGSIGPLSRWFGSCGDIAGRSELDATNSTRVGQLAGHCLERICF